MGLKLQLKKEKEESKKEKVTFGFGDLVPNQSNVKEIHQYIDEINKSIGILQTDTKGHLNHLK